MNSIVSAASLATATAVVDPSIASAPPSVDATSFPELVARFVRSRERWRTQRARDQAEDDKIDNLLVRATGLTRAEQPESPSDPRWDEFNAAHHRIMEENPSDDPVDEEGASIAWNEINDELWPLAKAMLNQTPHSLTDLAWQAEAILTADPQELQSTDDNPGGRLLRSLLENISALAAEAERQVEELLS